MVQKSTTPAARRGRPRAYDPERALLSAMAAFWDAGYAATSLDDLAAATGMNRPSLYGAFGDKHALYRSAIERYRAGTREVVKTALAEDVSLREALRRFYQLALSFYFPAEGPPRGCFLIGTAVTESVLDPDIRGLLNDALREIDKALEARIRHARDAGELPRDADPLALARVAAGILYFLAVRSRAGEPRAALDATAAAGIDLICGKAKHRGATRSR